MDIQISNWKDLKAQFGLHGVIGGIKSAIDIHRDLRHQLKPQDKAPAFIDASCTNRGEAIALFELDHVDHGIAFYTYTGTAN